MLIRLASVALALAASLSAADAVREVFYRGVTTPVFGDAHFQLGYLYYTQRDTRIIMYSPEGLRRYDIDVRAPNQEEVRVSSVAVDRDGMAVAAISYGPVRSPRGALVFFNAAGQQTRFLDVFPFRYSAVCFSEAHFIWAYGGLSVPKGTPGDYPQDPRMLHKYTDDGREVGTYLPMSSLPENFTSLPNVDMIRVATDRIGLFGIGRASPGRSTWMLVEVDLQGREFSRWNLGNLPSGGIAFTDHHGLYGLQQEGRQRFRRLMFYDRDTSSWKPVNDEQYTPGQRLLGADGNNLVMWDRPIDPTLRWFPAPQ